MLICQDIRSRGGRGTLTARKFCSSTDVGPRAVTSVGLGGRRPSTVRRHHLGTKSHGGSVRLGSWASISKARQSSASSRGCDTDLPVSSSMRCSRCRTVLGWQTRSAPASVKEPPWSTQLMNVSVSVRRSSGSSRFSPARTLSASALVMSGSVTAAMPNRRTGRYCCLHFGNSRRHARIEAPWRCRPNPRTAR